MTSKKKGQEEGGTQCRQSGVLYREREREGRGRAIAQGNTPNIRQSVFRSGWSICAHGHGAGGRGGRPQLKRRQISPSDVADRTRLMYTSELTLNRSRLVPHMPPVVWMCFASFTVHISGSPRFFVWFGFFAEPIDSSAVRLFSRSVILFVCLKTTTRRRRTKFGHQRLQIRMNLWFLFISLPPPSKSWFILIDWLIFVYPIFIVWQAKTHCYWFGTALACFVGQLLYSTSLFAVFVRFRFRVCFI